MHPSIQFAAQAFTDLSNTLPPSARSAFQQIAQMHLQELIKATQPVEAKPTGEAEGSVK